MSRTLYIPARSPVAAERIAYAIDDGRLACSVEYLSPADAARRAAEINLTDSDHATYAVPRVASPDGWVRVARLLDQISDIAAAIALFALIPLVGLASKWEHFA